MYGQVLNNFQLTSPAADKIFPNCTGDAFRSDTSFLATLRAIIVPRMKEGDTLRLTVVDVPASAYNEGDDGAKLFKAIRSKTTALTNDNSVVVVNIGCRSDSGEDIMKRIDAAAPVELEGYKPHEFYAGYFKANASTDARIFMNAEKRSTVMIVANLSTIIWHMLASTVCKTLPWYFIERPGKDDPEVCDILTAILMEKTPDKFKEIISKIERRYDFRSASIKEKLDGYERRYDEHALRSVQEKISRIQNKIKELYNSAADQARQLHDSQVTEAGLKETIAHGGSNELMEYFLVNKHLELEEANDDELRFSVGDYYVDMWDEDACELAISKHGSAIYSYFKSENEQKNAERFFRAVFQKELLKIKVCAAYSINPYGGCAGLTGHSYPEWMADCMPNPHTEYYGCLGGHEAIINQATNAGNYISAVEQCCAACRNLNFSDSTVMSKWSNKFFAMDKPCVELPDGSCVKPKEAIKWAVKNVKD